MSDLSYDLIKKGLDAASIRQENISSNIANVNTPDYKANRVVFEELLRKACGEGGITMSKTHEGHLAGGSLETLEPVIQKDESTSVNENGNNVDVDMEMTNLAANEIYYSALIQQVNHKLGIMNYVINK